MINWICLRRTGVFGLLAGGLLLAGCGQQSGPSQASGAPGQDAPEVGVVVLRPRAVTINSELPGRTTAYLTAEVRPQVAGIIKQRGFKEGGEIASGDVLYQIDPASYQATFDSAAAALQKAEAAVPSAQAKVERYQGLIREKAVSQQDFDDAVSTLAQAKAAVAAAKADLDTARINVAYTQIKAPIAGIISKSSISVGALVTASQTTALATIRQIDPIYVDLTQSSVNHLKFRRDLAEGRLSISGTSVPVRLLLEDGSIYAHAGRLAFAEVKVDESTGTFTLRAEFPNPERLLLPGMYVRAIIEEGITSTSFLVPQRAVGRNTKGEATALVVGKDLTVEERVLAVRRQVGSNWLVDGGVAAGDRVIVEGSMKTRAGGKVRAVEVTVDDATGQVRRAAPEGGAGGAPAAETPPATKAE
jgi:membrane fusion protein (multidrug efflux system)